MTPLPTIHCVMGTRAARWSQAQLAVSAFASQTYPLATLTVAVGALPVGSEASAIRADLARFRSPRIRLLFVDPCASDEAIWLAAIQDGRGVEFTAAWADHDQMHPARLVSQFRHMTERSLRRSCLNSALAFDPELRRLGWLAPGTPLSWTWMVPRAEARPLPWMDDAGTLDQLGHLLLRSVGSAEIPARGHRFAELDSRADLLTHALPAYSLSTPLDIVGSEGAVAFSLE